MRFWDEELKGQREKAGGSLLRLARPSTDFDPLTRVRISRKSFDETMPVALSEWADASLLVASRLAMFDVPDRPTIPIHRSIKPWLPID